MSTPGSITTDTEETLAAFHACLAKKIANDDYDLPMLPQVASEVMSMANNPDADLADLSALIHKDQTLAGNVIRISNSASFGSTEKIVSLDQAVARLGMALMGEIALSASLKQGAFSAPGFEEVIKNLWAHSVASGALGKEIARSRRYNVEGQFLSSLLHAVGKPTVLNLVVQAKKDLGQDISKQAVLKIVETFHVDLGIKIGTKWKLPQTALVCIEFYNNYAEAKQFKNEVFMTHLSHSVANWVLHPDEHSEEALRKNPIFMEMNFYPDDIQTLLDKKESVLETVQSMAI